MNADCRLATYGTLRPGQPNHHGLSKLRGEWSRGSVHDDLRDSGWGAAQGYPGLGLNPDGETVSVDLLSSGDSPDHWPRLDAFEGGGYRRVVVAVTTPDGIVDACIYELAAPA